MAECEISDSECGTILSSLMRDRNTARSNLDQCILDSEDESKMRVAGSMIKTSISLARIRLASIENALGALERCGCKPMMSNDT